MIRKSGEESLNKTYQSLILPLRIVLKPSLHYGLQNTTSFDATTSTDHSSKYRETCSGEKYRETCSGEIDFRIQGLLHSTIPQTAARKQSKSWFISSRRIKSRSVESRLEAKSRGEPIQRADEGHDLQLGNMEYFEMCEITPKQDHFRSTVPPLYDRLDERHCVLYLRNMLATFGQNSQSQQGSVRCSVDSKLRDKERSISRCTSHVSANKARKKGLHIHVG